jgi:ribosomal-protein-alanine N-acetyltransferase
VTLRRGWARAEARPWNGRHLDANLRILRGGPGFVSASAETLLELGAPTVISPPLTISARPRWEEAGFEPHTDLFLLRLELDRAPRPPDHLVASGDERDLPEVVRIDDEAFDDFWSMDERGIQEAMGATSRTTLLVIRNDSGGLCGFAIIGLGHALAYLQRVAVDPEWQGRGMGRSLVRAGGRTARNAGAGAMLLNTQTENEGALRLYESEGYVALDESLVLLRRSA